MVAFWKKDIEFNFTDKEIALYFYLLKVSNEAGWKNPFGLSNALTIAKFNWGKTSFDTAKNTLKKAGLIDFKPGDGRGNVYQYCLKVFQKNTLSDTLSVHLSDTLSDLKPATSISSKDKTSFTDANASVTARKKSAEKNLLYRDCLKIYDDFIKNLTGAGSKIDGTQGKAMKSIIAFLKTQVRNKDSNLSKEAVPGKVEESLQTILSNWHLLPTWLQGRTRLTDISSELQNILKGIKDGITNNKKPTGGVNTAAKPITERGASVDDLQALKRT